MEAVRKEINNKFPAVKVTGESTPGVTGWLEVSVNGTLVHSKKEGDGYVDTKDKVNKILTAVDCAMNGQTVCGRGTAAAASGTGAACATGTAGSSCSGGSCGGGGAKT